MEKNSGKIRPALIIAMIAGLTLTVAVFAQQSQQSTSQSTSSNGNATASSSASATSSGTASGQPGQLLGGKPNKPTYAVWYSWNSNRTQSRDLKAESDHVLYMAGLTKSKSLYLEGPFADGTGSLAVILARNSEEALQIVRNDPAIQSGKLEFVLKEWNPRFGMSGLFPDTTNQKTGRLVR